MQPTVSLSDVPTGLSVSSSTDDANKRQRKERSRKMVKFCEASSPYRRLVVVLKYCGLLFYLPAQETCGLPISWTVVYYSIVLLATWANVFRFFSAYTSGEEFGPSLVSKVMTHAFFIKSSVCITSCTFLSLKRAGLWKMYSEQYETFGHELNRGPNVTRRVNIALGISFTFVAAGTGQWTYKAIIDGDWLLKRMQFEAEEPTTKTMTLVFICFQAVITSGAWILPVCLLVLVSLDLRDSFVKFTCDLRKEVKANEAFQGDLEYFRQRHRGLCRIVEALDDIYTILNLNVYVSNIPIICLLLYVVILDQTEPDEMATMLTENVTVVVACFAEIMVVTAAGTALNSAALSCRGVLYSLNLRGQFCTCERVLQYLAFLMLLGEGHIGLSGWKLFYINKQTIKTVVLMIVSYTVILLKFGNLETKGDDASNGTNSTEGVT